MFNKRAPFVPDTLHKLGFTGKIIRGHQVIIPPVVTVRGGPFLMGSLADDPLAYEQEVPQHTVTLPEYRIGKYPITVAEYLCAIRAGVVAEPQPVDRMGVFAGRTPITWERQLNYPDHPVVGFTFPDFVQYALWLASLTHMPWKVPTEAEWEKAARGTDGRAYPWGNDWDPSRANVGRFETEGEAMDRLLELHLRLPQFEDPATRDALHDEGKGITPVGAFPGGASPYGAIDMIGNVWEITATVWPSPYPYFPPDGRNDVTSPAPHVLRGGSWYLPERLARCACRNTTKMPQDHFGARLVLRG